MRHNDGVAGFILAGGASSRMGRDKALLEIGGVPLLVRTARLLEPRVARLTVVGASERYSVLGLRTAPDDYPGAGPLGGIATSLRLSSCEWNLIVGCDLPYLTAEWLHWLIARGQNSPADAVVAETQRGFEPLCAMYRARCWPILAAAVSRGVRRVTDALAELNVDRVVPAEWQAIDGEGAVFRNMNTPEDYNEARRKLERTSGA